MGDLKVFTTQGRLNRMPYNIFSFALMAVSFFILMLFEQVKEKFVIMKESDFISKVSESDVDILLLVVLLIILILILTFIGDVTLSIRRLHDLNLSGWWYMLIFILSLSKSTILNLIALGFYIYLIFKRGTVGENKYGTDPLSE